MQHPYPHAPAGIGSTVALALGVLVTLATPPVAATPPPFHPYAREIDFVDLGSALAMTAELHGLDRRRDVLVSLVGEAEVELSCLDPSGVRVAAQTPARRRLELSGVELLPRREVHFGRLDVEVRTDALGPTIAGAPDCPSRRWTERVEQVRFRRARVEVHQSGRDRIDLLCAFTRPSSDGRILRSRVHCFAL